MGLGLSESKFRKVWEGLETQQGKFTRQLWINHSEQKGYETVWAGMQFESGTLKAKVVFDSSDKVTGLFFQPWCAKWSAPDYVDDEMFGEMEVTIGSGKWELPGTLTLPKRTRKPPVAVLVHGSGPHDRDETIGPNKPSMDLAWGLASKGIAVMRYEKRS